MTFLSYFILYPSQSHFEHVKLYFHKPGIAMCLEDSALLSSSVNTSKFLSLYKLFADIQWQICLAEFKYTVYPHVISWSNILLQIKMQIAIILTTKYISKKCNWDAIYKSVRQEVDIIVVKFSKRLFCWIGTINLASLPPTQPQRLKFRIESSPVPSTVKYLPCIMWYHIWLTSV